MDQNNSTSWRHATRGVRVTQWEDVMIHAFGAHWQTSILDTAITIKEKKKYFQTEAFAMIKLEDPCSVRERRMKKVPKIPISISEAIQPRPTPLRPIFNFALDGTATPLHIIGDSSIAIGWLTGTKKINDQFFGTRVKDLHSILYTGWAQGLWRPREFWQPFCSHVYREHNKGADALATGAIKHRKTFVTKNIIPDRPVRAIQCYFDGGHKDGVTGAGVVVDVSYDNVLGSDVRHNKWINAFGDNN